MEFQSISRIADKIKSAILLFSCGKDSICLFHLLQRYDIKIIPVYFYTVPNLKIRQDIIKHYEKRFKTEIIQYPHPAAIDFIRTGRRMNFGDAEKYARKKTGETWILTGIRKNDSFSRRGMIAGSDNGIDYKQKKAYPIMNWTDKDVMHYIKQNKLPLPVDYRHGVKHEFNTLTVEFLNFLKHHYFNDYQRCMKIYPFLEIKMKRAEMYE